MRGRTHSSATWTWRALIAGLVLAIAAMSAHSAQAASTAAAAQGSVLGGFTAQRLPSFFRFSKNWKMLVAGSSALGMTCQSGLKFITEDDFTQIPVAASGRLQSNWALAPTKQSDGTVFGGFGSMTARLDRRHEKLKGTWRDHMTFAFTNGQTDVCDSGVVHFAIVQ